MNKVKYLEEIYRFYWEKCSRIQIVTIEKARDIKVFWPFFIIFSLLYGLLYFKFKEHSLINISSLLFIFLLVNLYPFFTVLISIRHMSLISKFEFIKTFIAYRVFNLFRLTVHEYDELMAFLNILIQEVKPKEEIQTIKDTFQTIFNNRDKNEELLVLFINSKFLSFKEYIDFKNKNMFYRSTGMVTNNYTKELAISESVYSVVDLFKNNLDLFLSENFYRKEKSFKNYYLEHVNFNGNQDVGFFWFSLIFNFPKTWKLDTIKTILNSCRISLGHKNYVQEGSMSIKNRKKSLIEKDLISLYMNRNRIHQAFSQYSEEQFKKIFIKNHISEEIVKSLLLLLKLEITSLPILKSWHEIYHFIDNYSKIYKVPKDSDALENFVGELQYSYIKSYAELGEMAHLLKNCLKARHEKIMTGISYIIKIKKDGQILGAIEVSNKHILEMAGQNNTKLSESRQIIQDLRSIGIIL